MPATGLKKLAQGMKKQEMLRKDSAGRTSSNYLSYLTSGL